MQTFEAARRNFPSVSPMRSGGEGFPLESLDSADSQNISPGVGFGLHLVLLGS